MVSKLDDIKQWLIDNNVNKFLVYDASHNKPDGEKDRFNGNCFKAMGDEGIEEKFIKFENWYNSQLSGVFVLKQNEGNSYNSELKFTIRQQTPTQLAPQPAAVSGVPSGYISEKEFETRLENERLKWRLEKMEQELKEYKTEANNNSGAATEFFKSVTPFVGPVLRGLLGGRAAAPAPVQIGSLEASEETQAETQQTDDIDLSEEEFKNLVEDLKRWKAADPDYLQLLHKISLLTADSMYLTAKQMLMSR